MDNMALTAVIDSVLVGLPQEIRDQIVGHASPSISPSPLFQLPSMVQTISFGPSRNPAIPPADRSKSPIKALPDELIRQIFAESLPAKGATIKCLCGDAMPKAEDRKPKRNRTSDLMTVCKRFKEIVKLAVYQERFFELHVHQGGTGGVELLDAGNQPLAYMESGSDDRFAKFTTADEYGFQHLKKIKISVSFLAWRLCFRLSLFDMTLMMNIDLPNNRQQAIKSSLYEHIFHGSGALSSP